MKWEWTLVTISALVYAVAFGLNRAKGKRNTFYYWLLGIQLALLASYLLLSLEPDNDPSHLASAYLAFMYLCIQGLAFNVLTITFLVKTLPASWWLKIILFLAVLLLQVAIVQKL